MAIEQPSFQQLDLINSATNFNAKILESDWTKLAEEKNVYIAIRPLIPKKPRFGPKLSVKKKFASRRVFVSGNEWNRYLDNYPMYKLTIDQYKSRHNQKRPDWALTYQERKNKTFSKNDQAILPWLETEGGRFHLVERERLYDTVNCVSYGAVRFTDAKGNCKRVIIIYPDNCSKNFHARKEDWDWDNGKWNVVSNKIVDKNEAGNIYNTFGRTGLS